MDSSGSFIPGGFQVLGQAPAGPNVSPESADRGLPMRLCQPPSVWRWTDCSAAKAKFIRLLRALTLLGKFELVFNILLDKKSQLIYYG